MLLFERGEVRVYVLLKDTDIEADKGLYIFIPYYDRNIERTLIELYYRGIAEGLVDHSVECLDNTDIEVKDFSLWIEEKEKNLNSKKVSSMLAELKENTYISE